MIQDDGQLPSIEPTKLNQYLKQLLQKYAMNTRDADMRHVYPEFLEKFVRTIAHETLLQHGHGRDASIEEKVCWMANVVKSLGYLKFTSTEAVTLICIQKDQIDELL